VILRISNGIIQKNRVFYVLKRRISGMVVSMDKITA